MTEISKVFESKPADIGATYLLYPSLHAIADPSDQRPSAFLKQSPADFVVHEIGVDGFKVPFEEEEAEENAQSAKDTEKRERPSEAEENAAIAQEIGNVADPLTPFFTEPDMRKFRLFAAGRILHEACYSKGFMSSEEYKANKKENFEMAPVRFLTKAERTEIHTALRKATDHLTSETIQRDDGTPVFRFRSPTGRDTNRLNAPSRPAYTHFTLRKENFDTTRAISLLSKLLHVSPKAFTFAGAKDKRAVTYQRVATRGVEWKRIRSAMRDCAAVRVASPSAEKVPLFLGDLEGNAFEIILRDVSHWGKTETQVVESLKKNGFINYYGPQRFGSSSCATHTVGINVVRGDLPCALGLVLKGCAEISDMFRRSAAALNLEDFSTNSAENFQNALAECPRTHRMEANILEKLSDQPKNYAAAWACIPRNTRRMYAHALQSYVWNRMVSKRLEAYGTAVVAGDLVQAENLREEPKTGAGEMSASMPVVLINAENISDFSIFDVVLPLPGEDPCLQYPANVCGRDSYAAELRALGAEGLMQCGEPGGYRKVMVKPKDMAFELLEKSEEGQRSVKLAFSLPKGCYATALLREVVRVI